jgi:glycosyltransferase involved in cell wall biosynthesis
MEAFVSGVPVIATECIGLGEVTKDTPVVPFEIGDANSLVEAISYFRANKARIEGEVREFRTEAARRFDVKETAFLLRNLIDDVRNPAGQQ